MAGSFPGVLLSQLLCAPFVVTLLGLAAIHPAGLDRLPGWMVDGLAYASVAVPALAAL